MPFRLLTTLLFLASCASTPNFWYTDALLTGNPLYDSSRLVYDSPLSHLKLEFLKNQEETVAYLFLDQHRFTPDRANPQVAEIFFKMGEDILKESIYLREGRMRLKLSRELTEQMILALQEGKPVTIIANELKEIIDPASFEKAYAKFLKGSGPLNFIKGPFE